MVSLPVRVRVSVAMAVVLLGAAGCGGQEQGDDGVQTLARAIVGGDTRSIPPTDDTMPGRAVVQIFGPAWTCSGTLIQRDVVLTAAHCFCNNAGLPVTGLRATVALPFAANPGFSVGGTLAAWMAYDDMCPLSPPPGSFPSRGTPPGPLASRSTDPTPDLDLAIIRLDRNLTTTEAPSIVPVYTNSDFVDRFCNADPSGGPFPFSCRFDRHFFAPPIQVVGYGTGKKIATLTQNITITNESHWNLFGSADGWWIKASAEEEFARPENGDSGGPIAFHPDEQPAAAEFGVFSMWRVPVFGDDFRGWAPTWNNGSTVNGIGPGEMIASFIEDADFDGVNDTRDNCPPSRCASGQFTDCFNPNQENSDGDTFGDACDNCAGATNQAQGDLDGDRIGDACDLCPNDAGGIFSQSDDDGDFSGNSCDLCPGAFNPPRACTQGTDCDSGVCVVEGPRFGRCPDNSICNASIPCRSGSCASVNMFSACAGQPDADRDGLGDACDLCQSFSESRVRMNSNPVAEARELRSALGDVCDTTPIYTVRPVLSGSTSQAPLTTAFTAFAGVGSESAAAPHLPFASAPVGFRHCNCRDFVNNLSLDDTACRAGPCQPIRNDFTNSGSNWGQVTMGAGQAGTLNPPGSPTPIVNPTLFPTYTSSVDCSDTLPHPRTPGPGPERCRPLPGGGVVCETAELCRVGTPQLITWFQRMDIDATPQRVRPFFPSSTSTTPSTVGIFWSHGDVTSPAVYADTSRDMSSGGRLRDFYTYVATPALAPELIPQPKLVPINPISCATNPQCKFTLRPDLCRYVNPTFRNDISVFEAITSPAILDVTTAGLVRAVPGGAAPALDLTPRLSTGVKGILQDPSASWWLTPGETGARGCGIRDTRAVVTPRNWIRNVTPITRIIGDFDGWRLETEIIPDPDSPPLPTPTSPFTPADRDDVRWLYSAREQGVYMVGGLWSGSSAPTGEIWRYDLETRNWRHLFGPTSKQVPVGNVMALAYDQERGKLVVVDRLFPRTGEDPPLSRIVVYDTRKDTSRVATLINTSAFTKVGLSARDDGKFVMVGARWEQNAWTAYQFELNAAGDVVWKGKRTGTGKMIADPVFSDAGVSNFVHDGQTLVVTDLKPSSFVGSGPPTDLGVCDHAPTLTPPPNITISQCALPEIGQAVASNVCGGVARVTRLGPMVFPLGQTAVTWKAVDVVGRTTTATQTVTVTMGADPNCCPEGSNVIVGTSNNDVLTGTSGADCIIGMGGQDVISGGGGDDFISAGDGDDVVNGGDGNDTILGGSGQDALNGDAGNDTLSGGDGDDTCRGGIGNDVISGGQGQDKLFGDAGDDSLSGDAGDDRLDGGTGRNTCNGGPDHNTLLLCN